MTRQQFTNVSASLRKDDGAIVVSTDAHVSHKKGAGPWRSTFSMSATEAITLRDQIDAAIAMIAERDQ